MHAHGDPGESVQALPIIYHIARFTKARQKLVQGRILAIGKLLETALRPENRQFLFVCLQVGLRYGEE